MFIPTHHQILDSKRWAYTSKGWESVFLPLSDSCTAVGDDQIYRWTKTKWTSANDPLLDQMKHKVVYLPPGLSYAAKNSTFRRLAVHPDTVDQLVAAAPHYVDPRYWWVGQLVAYVFRLNTTLQHSIEERYTSLGFKSPVVGVHIRRTDKVGDEAGYHPVEEYMKYVTEFYERVKKASSNDGENITRRVFLATDEPRVIAEAKEKWPDFTFIFDEGISRSAGKTRHDPARLNEASLRGIITDLYMLSRSDFVVCTMTSNICRIVHELKLTRLPHRNAPHRTQSVDSYDEPQTHFPYVLVPFSDPT